MHFLDYWRIPTVDVFIARLIVDIVLLSPSRRKQKTSSYMFRCRYDRNLLGLKDEKQSGLDSGFEGEDMT